MLCERQGTSVPKFFVQFIQHIEKVGLDVVGIYRLSGNAASVNKLRYLVDQGKRWGGIHQGQKVELHQPSGATARGALVQDFC